VTTETFDPVAAALRIVGAGDDGEPRRQIRLTPASAIKIRRVRWVWDGRMALGALTLLAGREGLGKSTIGYWIASHLTRGELPGEFCGQPRSVLVCATEDSWSHTIAPRLIAAGADLDRVFRVEVDADGQVGSLSLPRDLDETATCAVGTGAALLLLDPLLSRLARQLDTHKDAEVRSALEPLVRMADRTQLGVLGVVHLNKSIGTDPINAVMGSRAFAAVARSVCVVVPDPEDEDGQRRLFGTPKNNLGPTNLPLLPFAVVGHPIDSADGTVWTGRVEWDDPITGTIADAMERVTESRDVRSSVEEAGDWLVDWLGTQGGEAQRTHVIKAGRAAGHGEDSLKRAMRKRPTLSYRSEGMPRRTIWYLTAGKTA
jgi:hypothetical protein